MNKTQLDKTLGTIKNYVDKKNYISSRGIITAESGTTYPAQKGLSMTQAYNNSYPISYGNVMTMYGSGVSQLLIGWSGTSGSHEKAYIRSKRDTSDANYSGWAQIYTSAHPQPSVTGSSGSCTGNAATATKLATARTINGTSFNGSADITTANWGTSRKLNRTTVNGSADVSIPLDYITCTVGDNNTNNYHLILESGKCTSDYTDKSIVIMVCNHYNNSSFGIAKATLRTNNASGGDKASGELIWIVRSGFAANVLCYNIRNTAKDTYMDVFYKSSGTYNSATIYILGEGARGNQSSQWTKNNTNATGTKAYTETAMKALRSYTSTLVSAVDAGVVNKANQLVNSRKIKLTGDVTGEASFNGSADATITATVANDSHTHSTYLPLSGGNMTGKVGFTTSATSTDTSQPTQLAYGLLSSYGNLKIIGNSDDSAGANNEYVHIATAWGLSPAVDKGIVVYGTYANCFGKKISTEGHTHSYLPLSGGTLSGKITFQDQLGGGGLSSLINCNALHRGTGNGQMITASDNHIYVGNPNTPITIEGNTHPKVNVNGTEYTMYHTGNKPSASDIGAAASSHIHNTITTKGTNTINGTANDTTANWGAQGNSVHWYTTAGLLKDQPSQWGYILNIGSGTEVHQLWMTQASGNLAHRGGNASGWSGTWRTILDNSNFSSYALPLSGGTLTGSVYIDNSSEANLRLICGSRNVGFYTNGNNWGLYDYVKDTSIIRYNFDKNRVEVQGKRAVVMENYDYNYKIRGGSGMSGADGYITFSW